MRRCVESSRCAVPERRSTSSLRDPRPPTRFPWWSFAQFVDVFPECVQGTAPQMDEESMKAPHEKYDLVVLAYQVWYLAPALPVVGWLESRAADVLRDTPVVALCACRNMWQRAFIALKTLVAAKGGRLIDHVVREDSGPAWATFWTTPRWMLTGDKVGATKLLPVAGIADADIASLSGPGEKLGVALMAGALGASVLAGAEAKVHRLFVIPELVGRFFFGRWAALITANRKARWLLLRTMFFSLCSSLPLMVPAAVVALFIRLFARKWFQGKVDEVAA